MSDLQLTNSNFYIKVSGRLKFCAVAKMYKAIFKIFMVLFFMFSFISQTIAFAPIKKYTDAPGMLISPNFSLKVNGTESISVEKTRYLSYAKFALAGKGGSIKIQITVLANSLKEVSLWPRKLGIVPSVDEKLKTITFNLNSSLLTTPQKFILKADSMYLAIFVDIPELNAPKLTDANVKNILDFGINNTGATLQTSKIQNAIDWMAANTKGKTILYFPNGLYKCASITISNSLQIYLQEGVRVQGPQVTDNYQGATNNEVGYFSSSFFRVKGNGTTSFKLFGRGLIDGDGTEMFIRTGNHAISLLHITNCSSIIIKDVILRESSSWTCHIENSSNIDINNVKVINPSVHTGIFASSHFWNDSFDATSCINYTNNNSFAWSNDDCIAIMSRDRENDNITFNNLLGFTVSSGVRLGWNSSKSFKNINITNSEFVQTAYATISLHELRNNAVYNDVTFSNCWFDTETSVGWRDEVIKDYVFYRVYGPDFGPGFAKANTLTFRNCNIERQGYMYFIGDSVHTIKNVIFNNVTIDKKVVSDQKDILHLNLLNVGKFAFSNLKVAPK